ncbi:hypothetical protein BGX38DRAFT_817874 [Terfezia claveryi]|nr:hypothetical protein BGX38DRAFT_817874 [Terfezia claveryi]
MAIAVAMHRNPRLAGCGEGRFIRVGAFVVWLRAFEAFVGVYDGDGTASWKVHNHPQLRPAEESVEGALFCLENTQYSDAVGPSKGHAERLRNYLELNTNIGSRVVVKMKHLAKCLTRNRGSTHLTEWEVWKVIRPGTMGKRTIEGASTRELCV